ncbi:hypothetical protein [Streptomyces sp. NRRL S-241]|uniref:hypothetical protein n=1 Tax=Streptomyces sp. NRRL S-241 TaxID=1463896 RepID=UPI00068F881E|nr:hypothetical protein [Streptomyces sp. NRRL S-241]
MPTTVVGFRLGCDGRGRQVTVFVSQSGVLYRSAGPYGKRPVLVRPEVSPVLSKPSASGFGGEQSLARPIGSLLEQHAECLRHGLTRELIPPVVTSLAVEEDLPAVLQGRPRLPQQRLTEAFLGAVHRPAGSLEDAIRQFRAAVGPPRRPAPVRGRSGPERPLPPRAQAMLRALGHRQVLTPGRELDVAWAVTGDGVRLHTERAEQMLDRAAAAELHAALTAWLRYTDPS